MRVSLRAVIGLSFFIGSVFGGAARAANWTNASGNSSWNTAANWDAAVPNAVDAIANFTLDITSDSTITLDGSKTVGTLNFADLISSNNWILNPGAPASSQLTLDVTAGSAVVNVANFSAVPINGAGQVAQSATINAVVAGNDGVTKTGAGTLVLTATNTYTGGTTVRFGGLNLDFSAT